MKPATRETTNHALIELTAVRKHAHCFFLQPTDRIKKSVACLVFGRINFSKHLYRARNGGGVDDVDDDDDHDDDNNDDNDDD